jgi:hypothetical protein
MSHKRLRTFLEGLSGGGDFVLAPESANTTDTLLMTWREAMDDARAAYVHWRSTKDLESYALYRAAADRADAAQDALSERHGRAA